LLKLLAAPERSKILNYGRAMIAEAGAGTASYPSPIFSAGGLFLLFASN
jgi:hypothetical protein